MKRSMARSSLCTVLLVAAVGVVTVGAGGAGTSPKPAKPQALCQFVSSAKDKNDKSAVNFEPGQARTSLDALRKAGRSSLPGDLKGAIKQLIPLYEVLAQGGNGAAFTELDRYATKQCGFGKAEDIEACALVSREEAEAAAGTPLEEGLPGEGTCSYPGLADGPTARVDIYVGDKAKSYLDVDRNLGTPTPIPGLGDEAYLKTSGDVIYFQQSGIWVTIQVIRLSGDYSQVLQDLARKVVALL